VRVSLSGLKIDSPATPLLLGLISYQGITDAAGAASGLTLVCGDLVNEPSYDGMLVKIRSGPAAGPVKPAYVHAGNTLTFATPWRNAAGAIQQITAGTLFDILSISGGGSGPTPAPSEGLSYYGIVDAVPGANQFTIGSLAGLGAGKFDGATNPYYAFILRDTGGAGAAPQGEYMAITAYATGTGVFTTGAFTAAVAVGDEILIIHPAIIAALISSGVIENIFNIVNAIFKMNETGGTLTADGAEQNIYISDSPMGVFEPRVVKVDCTNMAWGDAVILRWYERLNATGGLVQKDEFRLEDVQAADLGTPPIKNIELEPNRFGIQVTLQQVAGAAYRDFVFEIFYEV